MVTIALSFLFAYLAVAQGEVEYDINHANRRFKGYEDVTEPGSGPVTVHVIPHTHDDVGWLKTVDQYYYGSREEIYKAGVQYILDTVVAELMAHPEKTFIYVEIAFFKRWWEEQDNKMKDNVKFLLKNKQFEFINGGYCMNDEASVHYTATIDQMSEGLRWLLREFGEDVAPRIAWQIDPFGHSSAHAALSSQMGLEGLFFARMHYQDYDKRKKEKDLEFSWKVEGGSMFTGVLYRHYNSPPGFCFDRRCTDPPMVTNPASPEYNLPERVEGIVKYLGEQASHYRSGNIMVTMGGDFCYQNAHKNFKNLDILMKYINENTTQNGFKMIYSTPSRYMDAVLKSIGPLKNKTDDLFPYADSAHSYWTGYFTSRPTLKGYVRDCNNVLQTCKQIEAFVGMNAKGPTSETLRLAMGVSQHHDAVSGTSKQHVADDYSRRLAAGQTECEEVVNGGLERIVGFRGQLSSCRLVNESVCQATEHSNHTLTLVVYNPRAVARFEYIRIPLRHPYYQLVDLRTKYPMQMSFVEVSQATRRLNPRAMPIEGVMRANLIPMGFTTYQLIPNMYLPSPPLNSVLKSVRVYEDIRIESQIYIVHFDGKTGEMKRITDKLTGRGITDSLTPRFMEYNSSIGDKEDKQPSGAYIFRPEGETAYNIGKPVLTNYIPGPLFSEIWQTFSNWTTLVTRVYVDKFYIEVEWTVGPIPLDHGREVILRYDSSLATNKTFYTDSNGREMVKRVLNQQPTWDLNVTEPVAGNYYPVNTRAILKDEERGIQLTVLTDRSQGAASLQDGEVEFMVHRRILKDDFRGVSEPLNETQFGHGLIARGKHWLFYSGFESIRTHRVLGLDLFYKPTVAIGLDEKPRISAGSFLNEGALATEYINVVSIQAVNDTAIMLRLENILPESEGGTNLSVNLARIFSKKVLVSYEELALGADRHISKITDYAKHTKLDLGNTIILQPFQIRTFIMVLL